MTVLLFANTVQEMVAQWYRSQTFQHGFLILPISLYLVWRKRGELGRCEPRPIPAVLVLVAGLVAFWAVAHLAFAPVGEEFALVALLPTFVWMLLGHSVVRYLLFPLLFLFFMVPVGDFLIFPMNRIAVWIVLRGLEVVSLPTVVDGNLISVPSGTWQMTRACSGLIFLISTLMLSCLFAHLVFRSRRRQLVFVFSSVAFSVIANGLRALGLVLLGEFVSMQVASGLDHLIFGFTSFVFLILVLFCVGWQWRNFGSEGFYKEKPGISASDAADITNLKKSTDPFHLGAAVAAVGLLLLASASLSGHLLTHSSTTHGSLLYPSAVVFPPWRVSGGGADDWKPQFRGATFEVSDMYSNGTSQVDLFVAAYAPEHEDAPLVSSANTPVDPGWTIVEQGRARSRSNGQPLGMAETVIGSLRNRRLVWSRYWVDGRFTDSPYLAKLLRVKALLLAGPRASAFVGIASDYAPDRAAAEHALQDFVAHASFRVASYRGPPR